jgi:phage terminase large subunit
MIKNNKNDPNWYCREESILTLVDEKGIPYISEEDVEEDRRSGMPEYLIQQEYYGNVQVNEETKYFAHAINQIYESGRIVSELFVPNKKVYAFYDIGVSDCTAITLAQFEGRGSKLWPVIIGYIENNNRDLRFYVDEIRRFCNRYNLPMGLHAIPHDGKNRSFNDGLKNTLDYLQEMGEQGIFVNRPSSHKVAIESIRQKLFMSAFNKENTQRLIDCLSNYEKEFDEKLGRYKDSPVHDWSSHGVKSFQTLALALEADLIVETSYDVIYLQ